MAGDEHHPQAIVLDVVGVARLLELARVASERCDLLVLRRQRAVAPEPIDRSALRDRHEPRTRVTRHAVAGPLHERDGECLLCEILGEADVIDAASKAGDEPRELEPEDCFDCGRRVRHAAD